MRARRPLLPPASLLLSAAGRSALPQTAPPPLVARLPPSFTPPLLHQRRTACKSHASPALCSTPPCPTLPAPQKHMAERFLPVDLDAPGLRIMHFDPPVFTLPGFFSGACACARCPPLCPPTCQEGPCVRCSCAPTAHARRVLQKRASASAAGGAGGRQRGARPPQQSAPTTSPLPGPPPRLRRGAVRRRRGSGGGGQHPGAFKGVLPGGRAAAGGGRREEDGLVPPLSACCTAAAAACCQVQRVTFRPASPFPLAAPVFPAPLLPPQVGGGNLREEASSAYNARRTSSSVLLDATVQAAHPRLRAMASALQSKGLQARGGGDAGWEEGKPQGLASVRCMTACVFRRPAARVDCVMTC